MPGLAGNMLIFRQLNQSFVKQIYLPLGKPVALVGDFIQIHPGVTQKISDIHMVIPSLHQLDEGVDDPAVVKGGIISLNR